MKKKLKKKNSSNAFFITIILVIGITFSYSMVQQFTTLNKIKENQVVMEKQLEDAQTENAQLKQEKLDLQKPQYIEKIARNELGMTKKGEMPYVSNVKNDD